MVFESLFVIRLLDCIVIGILGNSEQLVVILSLGLFEFELGCFELLFDSYIKSNQSINQSINQASKQTSKQATSQPTIRQRA
jgi:hypothetical protein